MDTLIVKYNAEDYGEPILTVGRINSETEQVRLVANYTGEMAVDMYNLLTHGESKEENTNDETTDNISD